MEVLYLLIPVSVLLVLVIVGVFGWAINNGQLDDLEREGVRILEEVAGVDEGQSPSSGAGKESPSSN
ncbi:cbb3-type cytochrome oxidase assembly protein CcoS [Paucibacter sp. DJ1R-11]|jgi:cbb3-type cytochrome oxidase maturation protein|uniref:cbb3-type cytochrome oxidase assembly protein CcoS n=1 Tax=unclassified Roseateles TaxID=2626991 RepID=UPI0021E3C7BA|nr:MULTISPECIES: cbb3-type cytochrome oxidase assembly protein CcoS [unclassified Roseateles]MCV2363572.1 cbb3-type cytochrome oxidase assembly protein CcoS [Paucibacter sp. DJ1R-11]MCV2422161.1 cbb3-type cytochrome oxidase assembly protein CcoS [Paucibacter sp. DJ4R-1]MCV2440255.1 cbb3-type cytochrome oxidase assembly protein CcoS [Paucibacter sp. DJ2R-2]